MEKVKKEKQYKVRKRSKYYKGWYRFLRRLVRFFLYPFFPTTVLGQQNIPLDGKYIMAGNHRSGMDVFAIGLNTTDYKHFISKEEHLRVGILRWLFAKIDVFTVKRGKADMNCMRNVISALGKNEPIVIFPEGTRNKNADEELLALKNGTVLFAYKTGAAIVPFFIYRCPKIFRRNYVYILPSFPLSDGPQNGIVDRSKLDEGALLIRDKLEEGQNYLEKVIRNKRVRKVRQEDKKIAKKLKKQYKISQKNMKNSEKGQSV